jgi:hypothetical protein
MARADRLPLCRDYPRVMRLAIWLLLVQASLGAFDTLYYHEYRLKLAHGAHTRVELRLHASRDFAYAIIIGSLGFVTWHGAFAWVLLGLLLDEICITLWDFIEEDKIRRLPAGERAMHSVMGIVYGAFLAFLIPQMIGWSRLATGFGPTTSSSGRSSGDSRSNTHATTGLLAIGERLPRARNDRNRVSRNTDVKSHESLLGSRCGPVASASPITLARPRAPSPPGSSFGL